MALVLLVQLLVALVLLVQLLVAPLDGDQVLILAKVACSSVSHSPAGVSI